MSSEMELLIAFCPSPKGRAWDWPARAPPQDFTPSSCRRWSFPQDTRATLTLRSTSGNSGQLPSWVGAERAFEGGAARRRS